MAKGNTQKPAGQPGKNGGGLNLPVSPIGTTRIQKGGGAGDLRKVVIQENTKQRD